MSKDVEFQDVVYTVKENTRSGKYLYNLCILLFFYFLLLIMIFT